MIGAGIDLESSFENKRRLGGDSLSQLPELPIVVVENPGGKHQIAHSVSQHARKEVLSSIQQPVVKSSAEDTGQPLFVFPGSPGKNRT